MNDDAIGPIRQIAAAEPLRGARMAAFWLYIGRSSEEVAEELASTMRLSPDEAHAAIEQAIGWLRVGKRPPSSTY